MMDEFLDTAEALTHIARSWSCRALYRWWVKIRGTDLLPRRDGLIPRHLGGLLPWMFILGKPTDGAFNSPDIWRFAGSALEHVFQQCVQNKPFLDFWNQGDRLLVRDLAAACREEMRPFAVRFSCADHDGTPAGLFDLMALPILAQSGYRIHHIGIVVPVMLWAEEIGSKLHHGKVIDITMLEDMSEIDDRTIHASRTVPA